MVCVFVAAVCDVVSHVQSEGFQYRRHPTLPHTTAVADHHGGRGWVSESAMYILLRL